MLKNEVKGNSEKTLSLIRQIAYSRDTSPEPRALGLDGIGIDDQELDVKQDDQDAM